MTTDDVAVLRRLYDDVWNDGNPATAHELVDDDYLIHDRDLSEELRGPELYLALAEQTRAIFPDATFTIADTVAEGSKVALHWTMTGTHEGTVFGLEPTGERVRLEAIELNRFEAGALAETWTQSDTLSLLEQLGASPFGE